MTSSIGVLIDECLPRRLAQWFTEQGCQNVASVHDLGLFGASDEELLQVAQQNNQVFLTLDWKRTRTFRPSDSPGIVCLKPARDRTPTVYRAILSNFMNSGYAEECKHKALRLLEERFVMRNCAGNSSTVFY